MCPKKGVLANFIDSLSVNVKRGIREKLHRGEWPSLAPIGYVNNLRSKTIEADPAKASLVRKAFVLYATGQYTLRAVANELKALGLRSHKDNVLSVSSMQRMLQNPVYYGVISRCGELYRGSHEPLIAKRLFDETQAVMAGKAKRKRVRKHEFLFSGLMQCGSCGCAITAEAQKGHTYYRCTKKRGECEEKYLREESLLEQIRSIVEQVTLPDDWAEKMLHKLGEEEKAGRKGHRASVRCLEEEKTKLEQRLDTLLDMHLDGSLARGEYIQKKNRFLNRKVELEQQIRDSEQNGNGWLEPMREIVLRSSQAKILLSADRKAELPTFLWSVGSNFRLRGKMLQWQAHKGWRALQNRATCSNWLSGRV